MKKKILSLLVLMLIISISWTFVVSAGSEENPQIVDEEDNLLDYIDAVAAWFFEDVHEPEISLSQ